MMSASTSRYSAIAILLHWAIALAIAGMIPLGWWMGKALEDRSTQLQAIAAFQLHKSIGLTILALSLLRLAWRFMHPAPALPEGMKPWEQWLARGVHWAFYVVIIAMPLTGWMYVSTAWSAHDHRPLDVPTLYFGLFQIPHLFGLAHAAEPTRASLADVLMLIHSKLAWGAIVLAGLHVAAALKHQFVDRDNLIARMIPGPPGADKALEPARTAALAAGALLIVVAGAAAVWAFAHPPMSVPREQTMVVHSHSHEGEEGEHHNGDGHAAPAADGHEAAAVDHAHEQTAAASPAPAAPGAPAAPSTWRVDQSASSIVFTGVHAGVPFEGRFSRWRADIRFDPQNLAQSSAVVTVETASAADGVPLHDQSLPQEEWFDAASHPTATFRTSEFRRRGDNTFAARGTLTLKGRSVDVDLPFTLRIDGDRATMDGTADLDRRELDLGMASDPDFEYVSRDIGVRVHVVATRAR